MAYIPGDYWMVCEVCGFEYRSSRMRKRWDGANVCEKDWEQRHPQEFMTYVSDDKQSVPNSSPEPADYFLSENEVTAEDL